MTDNITATTEPIAIELVRTSFFTRWPCTVCGGCTEKVGILAEAQDEHGTIRVCEICLEKGGIDERLEERAGDLEFQAGLIRKLIGRLKAPTFAEWMTAERNHEVESFMDIDDLSREEAEAKVHPDYPRGPVEMLPCNDSSDTELPF